MLPAVLRNRSKKSWLVALVAFAAALLPYQPAAHAAVNVPVSITVSYNGIKLAGLYGTITFESGSRFSYSLEFCRESSYVAPSSPLNVNGAYYTFLSQNAFGFPGTANCTYTPSYHSGTVEYGSQALNVGFNVRAIYFSSNNTAIERFRAATYDNPLN